MRRLLATFVIVASLYAPAWAQQIDAPEPDRKYINSVLIGIRNNDYKSFSAFAKPEFLNLIPADKLASYHEQLGVRLKGGAQLRYAGKMRQRDMPMYLYVIKFGDGGDDRLVILTLHDLQVSGMVMY